MPVHLWNTDGGTALLKYPISFRRLSRVHVGSFQGMQIADVAVVLMVE